MNDQFQALPTGTVRINVSNGIIIDGIVNVLMELSVQLETVHRHPEMLTEFLS